MIRATTAILACALLAGCVHAPVPRPDPRTQMLITCQLYAYWIERGRVRGDAAQRRAASVLAPICSDLYAGRDPIAITQANADWLADRAWRLERSIEGHRP